MTNAHTIKFGKFEGTGFATDPAESLIYVDGECVGCIVQDVEVDFASASSRAYTKRVVGYMIDLSEYLPGDMNYDNEYGDTYHTAGQGYSTLKAARDVVRDAIANNDAVRTDVLQTVANRIARRAAAEAK